MTKTWKLRAVALAAICVMPAAQASVLQVQGIDLGGTTFYDGFSSTKPGWAYLGYFQTSQATHVEDNNGNDVAAFKSPDIRASVWINQIAYTSPITLFNGTAHLGFTALVGLVNFDPSFAADSPLKLTSTGGVGDITFGPSLQFNPIMRHGRPVYSQRVAANLIAPTGRYSSNLNMSPGANIWSFNPYWSATWLPTDKLEVSWRLSYIYNFKNTRPAALPPTVTSTQAGQAAWLNFSSSYALTRGFELGLNGYYYKQLTSDTYKYSDGSSNTGALFGDSGKNEIFAIGPGLHWVINKNNILNVNLYFQTMAKNTLRGRALNLMWVHPL